MMCKLPASSVSWALVLVMGLTSCAKLGGGDKAEAEGENASMPFGATGIPPQLRGKGPDSGAPVTAGPGAPTAHAGVKFTAEEDIVFTNPDNPDSSLPELSSLLADAPKRRGPWEESETIAKQRAAREGKPLLIWFTDSVRSPMCKALSQELFTSSEFDDWATDRLVRLRVDANIEVNDPDLSMDDENTRRVNLKTYVARLKKQYKILGHPYLVMLNPSGEVILRHSGYKRGQADYVWGLIKHNEAVSANAYKTWKEGMEKKGYREWHDRKGRVVFAKLTSYSNGKLSLIEPDGTRSRTDEKNLSAEDGAWIAEQKRLRERR